MTLFDRMSGGLWAIIAGVGFGAFQTINRRAVRGMDVFVATFLQLLSSAVVLSAITLLSEDWSAITGMSAQAMLNFALAGLFHFFIGWALLNTSQKNRNRCAGAQGAGRSSGRRLDVAALDRSRSDHCAAVLALSLVSVSLVNILSPVIVGQHIEGINTQVWIGSLIIIVGALLQF